MAHYYHILLPLLALLIALSLAIRALHYRTSPIATTFSLLVSALAVWSLAVVLEHAGPGLPAKVFWMKMSYFGIGALPPAWLALTLRYANRESWLTRRNLAMLAVPPSITLVMVWTNDAHHLMWKDIWLDTSFSPPVDAVTHNAWFWIQAGYSYLLILLGTLILLRVFVHSSAVYRKQVGIMLLAAMVPWAANIACIAGVGPFRVIDPTPLAFAVTGAAFSWGLFRLHLLNIMPVAHEAIFKNMVDGVIVLDVQGRVVELNPAAQRVLACDRSALVGRPYGLALPGQAGQLELGAQTPELQTTITLGEGRAMRHYAVSVSPIVTKRQFTGHLVLLHDDTGRLKTEAESRERIRLKTELV